MKNAFSKLFGIAEKEEVTNEVSSNVAVVDVEVKEPIEEIISEERTKQVIEIELSRMIPNQYQPRTYFDEDKIKELALTLQEHGLIQPIVVRQIGENYEIIAGERRYRAAKYLGWEKVPVIIKEFTDETTAAVALIENIQRENLTPIEEAYAYKKLIEFHQITQETLAIKLGKGQSTIANKLRLLRLPEEIQQGLLERVVSERHARALIPLKEQDLQLSLFNDILRFQLNVKQTEERVERMIEKKKEKRKPKRKGVSKDIRLAVNTIRQSLDMVTKTGLALNTEEEEHEEFYQFTIKIPKN